jgi:hypothetical protein
LLPVERELMMILGAAGVILVALTIAMLWRGRRQPSSGDRT